MLWCDHLPKPLCLPHQQHQNRAANQGNGCGELPSVASTVGPSTLICIFWKAQLLDGPLCHLNRSRSKFTIILLKSWTSIYTTHCTFTIMCHLMLESNVWLWPFISYCFFIGTSTSFKSVVTNLFGATNIFADQPLRCGFYHRIKLYDRHKNCAIL